MLSVTLIGERVNGWNSGRDSVWKRIYEDPDKYWAIMTSREAFRWAPGWERDEERCWQKLRSVLEDLHLDHTMQLLRPSQISGAWSINEARLAAKSLLIACPKPSLLICCGTRVSRAVHKAMGQRLESTNKDYPMAPGVISGFGQLWFTRIPHPSGRNTQWSNGELIAEIRDRLAVNLELLRQKIGDTNGSIQTKTDHVHV